MKMRAEVLSSVGAQNKDTNGYQVSADVDNVEFYWENDQLGVDAVFRPSIDTFFSPSTLTTLNSFQKGSRAENPVLMEEEQDKENFPPPHPTTPVSERPTQSPVLKRKRPFGTRIENVPDHVYRNLFEQFFLLLLCMYFNEDYN